MSELPHPPIPPNCPYFKKSITGEMCFFIDDPRRWPCGGVQLGDIREWQRHLIPLIAAAARCAWLDESERRDVPFKEGFFPTGSPEHNDCVRRRTAKENAENWRLWGLAADAQIGYPRYFSRSKGFGNGIAYIYFESRNVGCVMYVDGVASHGAFSIEWCEKGVDTGELEEVTESQAKALVTGGSKQ